MLVYHHKPVSLSFISTDLPILSTLETAATVYQKDQERFHVLLNQPGICQSLTNTEAIQEVISPHLSPNQLLWLEISPYRVIMTMQGNQTSAYRHFWEQGIYGTSRYWLNNADPQETGSIRLRNFTRHLKLEGYPLPERLRIEYELWSSNLNLGHYVLHLEIHQ
jgi:hypothetical protein